MLREAHIPLFLWLPAALILHALSGGGAHQAAQVARGRADIRAFSRDVRDVIHHQLRVEFDILGAEDDAAVAKRAEPPPPEDKPEEEKKDEPKEEPPPVVKLPPPKVPPKLAPKPPKMAKVEPPKPTEPKPEKKEEPKKEPEKVAKKEPKEKKPEEKKEAPQKIELPKPDGRIAVINDPSLDKKQKDNPNAPRIADEANSTKEETMARFLAYDQNASKPQGGGGPGDPSQKQPGNAEKDERGFSNDVKGDKDPRAGSEGGPTTPETDPIARSQDGSNKPLPGQQGHAGEKPVAPIDGGKGEVAPDIISGADGDDGAWTLNPDGDGKKRKKGRNGRKGRAGQPYIPGSPNDALGQYSINAYGLSQALGSKHLRREQEKARSTRIAKHRGSMKGNEFEKYRAAIQNYDPSVKPGNQTSLNAARVPFASYINKMHNAIHPIFADGFLGTLGKLDASDKLNDPKLSTHIEVVLNGETGAVVAAGIVRGSGVTAFDVAAIRSIYSAGPFGKAPEIIVSPDGNVYVHWEFYRDPYFACTSKFAMPYKLKDGGNKKDDKPGPRKPTRRSKERTAKNKKK
jgi:hypothetical protein